MPNLMPTAWKQKKAPSAGPAGGSLAPGLPPPPPFYAAPGANVPPPPPMFAGGASGAAAASGGSSADVPAASAAASTTEWRCEVCDRTFSKQGALQKHVSTHTACTMCDFAASKAVLGEHMREKHGKGDDGAAEMRARISTGTVESAEEIAKYIAERRRRYPTKANVEQKLKQAVDKAVLGVPADESDRAALAAKEGKNGASIGEQREQGKPVCRSFVKGRCRHGRRCHFAHPADARASDAARKKSGDKSMSEARFRAGRSLMQKLLERERRDEASKVLQCLRHLVRTDFFGSEPA